MNEEFLALSRIAVIAVVLGFLLAARAEAQGTAEAGGLRRWDFMLENVRYRILLPQRATTTSRIDQFSVSMSARLARQLHLRPAPPGSDGTYARMEKLSNGAVLKYDIDRDVGRGSGGTEGLLEGVLEIDGHVLAVRCSDQDELFAPRPEWCLQFLRHLKIDK